ncbi:MAG TPA: enoyl-CoA hydratase/isomerase family protein, partial [Tepidiformaceae bacterium]
MTDSVLYEVKSGIALVTLNRPESLNSMSGDMLDSLAANLASAAEDPEVRCVVITGAGRAFTAGGDVKV